MAKQKIADNLSTESEGIVVFLAGDRQVSNDPNFEGEKGPVNPFRAQAAENRDNLEHEDFVPDEVKRSQEARQAEVQDYSQLDGKELKRIATEERHLSLEGLRKKSQLVELLQKDDERRAAGVEVTGAQVQGGESPVDQGAEVAARNFPEKTETGEGESRGLSNDSDPDDDDEDDDEE